MHPGGATRDTAPARVNQDERTGRRTEAPGLCYPGRSTRTDGRCGTDGHTRVDLLGTQRPHGTGEHPGGPTRDAPPARDDRAHAGIHTRVVRTMQHPRDDPNATRPAQVSVSSLISDPNPPKPAQNQPHPTQTHFKTLGHPLFPHSIFFLTSKSSLASKNKNSHNFAKSQPNHKFLLPTSRPSSPRPNSLNPFISILHPKQGMVSLSSNS